MTTIKMKAIQKVAQKPTYSIGTNAGIVSGAIVSGGADK